MKEGGFLMEKVWFLIRFILCLSDAYSLAAMVSSIFKLGSCWPKNDFENRGPGVKMSSVVVSCIYSRKDSDDQI